MQKEELVGVSKDGKKFYVRGVLNMDCPICERGLEGTETEICIGDLEGATDVALAILRLRRNLKVFKDNVQT